MKLNFRVSGAGTPIVLTTGIAQTCEVWAPIAQILEACGRVLVWDHRGHGGSERCTDPEDYSPLRAVDDLLEMITAAGGGPEHPAILIGHSLGGYVSLRAAIAHPERVKALVLIATGPGFRDERAREEWNRFARSMTMPADVHDEARRLGVHSDAIVIEQLPTLSLPTLVIVGSDDRRFLSGKDYLLAKLRDATACVIEGGRHSIHQTHAAELAAAIRGFLQTRALLD